MEMRDNEFDKLFSTKLDGYEIQPSANVWQGITEELDKSKRKKVAFIPFLSIAASIIVLIAAGILFIAKRVEPSKNHPVKATIARINYSAKLNNSVATTIKPQINEAVNPKPAPVNRVAVLHWASKQKISITEQKETIIAKNEESVLKENLPRDADLVMKSSYKAALTVVDSTTIVSIKPVIIQPEKQIAIAANLPDAAKPVVASTAKRRRIKSFGDMLNVVIAAVDKRKNKIIEFSDTDDDEATITAVNLGVIKVKKED
jgi:hypothetical protein